MRVLLFASAAATLTMAAAAPLESSAAGPAIDRHDLSGVWMNDNTLDERMKREGRKRQTAEELAERRPAPPALTPAYQAIVQREQAERAKLATGAAPCSWPGMPSIMTYPYPFEILQTPGRVTLLFEAESQVRRIFLDRAQHLAPDDLDPSFNGDSIGHWEGDELVVDTIGFNTTTRMMGLPHSEDMRIGERIRWIGEGVIEDDMTITDPKA